MDGEQLQPSLFDRLKDDLSGMLAELGEARAKLAARLSPAQRLALDALYDAETGLIRTPSASDLAPFDSLGEAGERLLHRVLELERARRLELQQSRVLSPARLKECVRRDLERLLNTGHLEVDQDLSLPPHVRASTVNYGIRPLAGRVGSSIDLDELEAMLMRAISTFEPRIDKVEVRARIDDRAADGNQLAFEIEGDVWGQSAPSRLILKSLIDLDTGRAKVAYADVQGAG